jgi:twitching motility protein PilJ
MAAKKVKFSLSFKILFAILIIIVITASGTSYFLYNSSKNTMIETTFQDLATRIDELQDELDTENSNIVSRLNTISSSPLIINYINNEAQGESKANIIFQKMIKSDPAIAGLFVANRDLKLLYSQLATDSDKKKIPELDEFIDPDEINISKVYFEPYISHDFPYFIYYKAVVQNDKILGVLGFVIDAENILTNVNMSFTRRKFLAPQRYCSNCHKKDNPVTDKGFTIVYDTDGNVLLSPALKDGLYFGKNKEFSNLYKEIKKDMEGNRFVDKEIVLNSTNYYATFSKINFNDFKIVVVYLLNKGYLLSGLNKNMLILFGIISIVTFLIFLFSSISFRRMFFPLFLLSNAMEKAEEGDYDIRVDISSSDELGQLGEGFNEMLNRISKYIQTEEDQQRIQNQAIHLMDVVSQAADGDMTVEAEVTADELGAIADAFNMMTMSIRELIEDIRLAGESIVDATEQLMHAAEKTNEGAITQIDELNETAEKIKLFKELSLNASLRADDATKVTDMAANVAENGMKMLEETIDSMFNVRRYSQMASKKVKSLGERSMEIGEITNVISEISYQTNLLALNAAIEAARAGEYGHGFAVVADEIRKLAERSNKATKDIGELIKSIQVETAETVKLVEESTVNVEQSSTLAEQAGEALREINESLKETKVSVNQIASDVLTQSEEASLVSESIEKVKDIATETSLNVKQTNAIVTTLSQLAEMLKDAVNKFKVEK